MGDIYLFKMLILLIKMHIYVLNQKSKEFSLVFLVDTFFMSAGTMTLPTCTNQYYLVKREEDPLRPRSSDTSPKQGRTFFVFIFSPGFTPGATCCRSLGALIFFLQ